MTIGIILVTLLIFGLCTTSVKQRARISSELGFLYLLLIVFAMFLLLASGGCSTTQQSTKVFGSSSNRGVTNQILTNMELSIEVISNIYPPANFICTDFLQFDVNSKQCVKYITVYEYAVLKHPDKKLIDIRYSNNEITLILAKPAKN